MDEIEIVGRRVVFGKRPPNTTHQTAHRKIETGRTILTFIVTIRRKVENLSRFATMFQNVCCGAVDFSIPSSALLVVEVTVVPDTTQHQTMSNAPSVLFVSSQPGDGANRPWDENKAVRIMKLP